MQPQEQHSGLQPEVVLMVGQSKLVLSALLSKFILGSSIPAHLGLCLKGDCSKYQSCAMTGTGRDSFFTSESAAREAETHMRR